MRVGAASGESFGADAGNATRLHSGARNAAVQKGMARKRPFSYDEKPSYSNRRTVQISGTSRRAAREPAEPAELAPQAVSSGRIHRRWRHLRQMEAHSRQWKPVRRKFARFSARRRAAKS